jgi:ribonuclease Z
VTAESRARRIEGTFAGIPLRGTSVAGRETWFHFPTLGFAFELGRSPWELVSVPNVFLTHGHLDHAAGVAYWFSQRRLLRLPGGIVRTHPAGVERWRKILALHEELEGTKYDARIEGMEPGSRVFIRRDLSMACFSADHRVPTLAYVASEERRRLRPEHEALSREEIKTLAADGRDVAERVAIPLAAFSGDTSAAILDAAPKDFFRAKVLLLECSFVEERDRPRAAPFKHVHLDEIADRADLFENEVLLLTHLTLRTPPDLIRRLVQKRLPARLAARAVPFLPE